MSQGYPPYNHQPNSNQPRYPYSQQPYYPQQQPVIPHSTALHPQQKQRKSPKQIWRDAGKGGKCGIITVCLLLPLSLCICVSVATASTNHMATSPSKIAYASPSAPVPTHRPTSTPMKVPTPVPTRAPVPTPTALPPTPIPTQPPVPTSAPTQPPVQAGVNGNPWGYNFTPGNYLYNPNAAFCNYFTCVSTFWTKTSGYVAECSNGDYTHSGGVSGACSRDGGVQQPLYSH